MSSMCRRIPEVGDKLEVKTEEINPTIPYTAIRKALFIFSVQ